MRDEDFYLQATEEIKAGTMSPALAAKAFAKGEGEEMKTRAAYLELRVEQLNAEAAAARGKELAQKTAKLGRKLLKGVAVIGSIFVFYVIYIYFDTSDVSEPFRSQRIKEAGLGFLLSPNHIPATPIPVAPVPQTSNWTQAQEGEYQYMNRFLNGNKSQEESLKSWADDLTRRSSLVKTPAEIKAYTDERNAYLKVLSESMVSHK